MIYIVYGDQPYVIQSNVKGIAKKVLGTIDEMNYIRMDAKESSFQDVIDEASLTPLGYDNKVVSLENCNFLVEETKTLKNSKEYKNFISFIKNMDNEIHLILSVYKSNVDKKGEIYNIATVKGTVKELLPVTSDKWNDYVEQFMKKNNINIDHDAVNELANRTAGDVALFRNTIAKLTLYTNHITYQDIDLMVEKRLEDKVYLIYNHLIMKKNDMALKIYRDLLKQNYDAITIISNLANQFRLLHEIKYLTFKKKSNKEIASILNIKESRAALISRQIYSIDESLIRKTLDELYNLDYQSKSGLIDHSYALELFIIKFNQELF